MDHSISERLKMHGITEVVLNFYGSGDSGSLDEGYCATESGDVVPNALSSSEMLKTFDAAIDKLGIGGYEVNEGGGGSLVFSVGFDDQGNASLVLDTENSSFYENIEEDSPVELASTYTAEPIDAELLKGQALKVTMSFAGSGDSGDVTDFEVTDAEGNEVTLEDKASEAIEDALFRELSDHIFPGWEIDEGSNGTLVAQVAADGTLTIDGENSEITSYLTEEAYQTLSELTLQAHDLDIKGPAADPLASETNTQAPSLQ